MEKKNETLKIRVSEKEKATYDLLATRAGLSTSALVRMVMNSEGKVIFLEDGAKVAEVFCSCNRLLSHFMARGQLTDAERLQLSNQMDEIIHLLSLIAQSLTSIDIDGEEDN